jgi:hypothetical protein
MKCSIEVVLKGYKCRKNRHFGFSRRCLRAYN